MKIVSIAIAGLVLGCVVGSVWSFVEYTAPDADMDALLERLATKSENPVAAEGEPHLTLAEGNEFDFGVMDLSETRSHTFVVTNDGESPLTLELLGTTCKCAIGTLPDGAIPPGGSGEVTMEWTAKGEAPEYRQSATIETNDPVNQVLRLSVSGRVVQILRAIPQTVTLTDVPTSEPRTASFELVNFKESEFTVERFRWMNVDLEDQFEVHYEPMTAEELTGTYGALAGYRFDVTVLPGLPMGSFKSEMVIEASGNRELLVGVRGNVVTDIRVVGAGYRDRANRLDLGMVAANGATRELMILAKGADREGLQIEVGAIEPPVLTARVGEGTPLNNGTVWRYPLEIEVLPSDSPISYLVASGQAPATIQLLTNHPTVQEIKIAVSFAIGTP